MDYVTRTIRIRKDLYQLTKQAAASGQQSVNSFIVHAIARRVGNWSDPVTGLKTRAQHEHVQEIKNWEGWVCGHGSHPSVPAAECPHREKKVHQAQMYHEPSGLLGWPDGDQGEA